MNDMERMCVCGHTQGEHWHRAEGVQDCGHAQYGNCDCKQFILKEAADYAARKEAELAAKPVGERGELFRTTFTLRMANSPDLAEWVQALYDENERLKKKAAVPPTCDEDGCDIETHAYCPHCGAST